MPASFYHPKNASLLLTLAAAAILATVFASEHLGGLEPCPMCIWQRWPFAVLVVVGLIGALWRPKVMLTLAFLTLLVSVGLAGYHVGVEQGWLALPAGCASAGEAGSIDELKAMLKSAGPTCDQVAFTFLGLSFAGWNVVGSLILALFTLIVLTSSRRQHASMAHQT